MDLLIKLPMVIFFFGVMIGIAIMNAVQAYREIKAEEKDGDSDND